MTELEFASTEGKAQVAREVAAAFDAAAVNHAFIHGLERFPSAMGRDIDILIDRQQVADAVRAAFNQFRRKGWHFVAHRRLNGHYWCFVAPPNRRMVFEFDLIPQLRWGPAILVDRPGGTARHGGFRVDPWASFVKRVLMQVLGGNTAKLAERPAELAVSPSERSVVPDLLAEHFGASLATTFIGAVDRRDVSRVNSLIGPMRRAAIVRALWRHPASACASGVHWVRNELAASPIAQAVFPIMAIVGVDGVGKSSLLACLESEMRARLPVVSVETRHWRPRILPSLGRLAGKTSASEDHASRPPRRTSGRGQFVRVAYYGLDYCLGAWRDRLAAAQLTIVVYDRCVLDMSIDPVRFGLRSDAGLGLVRRVAPAPQLVILLHDDVERILRRKAELEPAEIDRQQAAWLALVERGDVHFVLRAQESPEQLAAQVVDYMIERFFTTAQAPSDIDETVVKRTTST